MTNEHGNDNGGGETKQNPENGSDDMDPVKEMIRYRIEERIRSRVGKIVGAVVGGFVLALLIGLVIGFLVKWLWNAVPGEVFGLPMITYWQAVGLFILAKLLFGFGLGNSSGGGGSSGGGKKHNGDRHRERRRERRTARESRFRDFWESEGKAHWEDWKTRAE